VATDLDGDGIPDLLSVPPPEQQGHVEKPRRRYAAARTQDPTDRPLTRAISGRDGRILWQTEVTEGKPTANWQKSRYERVVPAGVDLDGDGVPDLLATGKTNTLHMTLMNETFSPLVAISGRTGRHLWAADFQVSMWNGPQLLACRDLDGDGRPEVLFVSASNWDWPRNPDGSWSSTNWQYWLAVLDGATGRVKWKQPLSERNTSGTNANPASTPFSFAVADLDGDGAPDLVIEGGLPQRDGEVRAFRGRDGEPLWTWKPAPRPVDNGLFRRSRPTLTVGDLAGRRTVIVLHTVVKPSTEGNNLAYAELVALDARTGKPFWSWQHVVTFDFNDHTNGAVQSRVVPQFVELGGGRRAICLWTYDYDHGGQVVLLDEQGRELRTRTVDFRLREEDRESQRRQPQICYSPVYSPHFRVWTHELNDDGLDELIVLTNDYLQVLSGDLTRVRWEWPLPDAACDLFEVFPATAGRPATLVVRAGNRVVGLAGPDGRLLWTSAGSGTPQAVLPADGLGELPRVIFDLGDQATVCRRAQPADGLSSIQGFVPYAPPQTEDRRYIRPLPWNALVDRPPLIPASPWGIALMLAGLAGTVVVAPFRLWRRALHRRRWWLSLMPFAWLGLVWAGITVLYLVELNDDASFLVSRWGWGGFLGLVGLGTLILALIGLPLVVFVVVGWHWFRRRSWKRLAGLLMLAVALAGLAAWVWLQQEAPQLDDYERLSRSGWLGILPVGVYAVGVLVLAAWLARILFRLFGRIWRRPACGILLAGPR
jgi:hypothetical protein